MIETIVNILKNNKQISDFHIRAGEKIAYRVIGDIHILEGNVIEEKQIEELL